MFTIGMEIPGITTWRIWRLYLWIAMGGFIDGLKHKNIVQLKAVNPLTGVRAIARSIIIVGDGRAV